MIKKNKMSSPLRACTNGSLAAFHFGIPNFYPHVNNENVLDLLEEDIASVVLEYIKRVYLKICVA